jgi:hypothetical protein
MQSAHSNTQVVPRKHHGLRQQMLARQRVQMVDRSSRKQHELHAC